MSKEQLPEFNQSIVGHNLETMESEMERFLGNESIGGNAATTRIGDKTYACAAANGYANAETGEIITFSNAPPDQIKNLPLQIGRFTLRLALDLQKGFFKIVDIFHSKNFSPNAHASLEEAVKLWNAKHEN